MHGLIKKLMVVAGDDGLILYPSTSRNQPGLRIGYTTLELSSLAYSKRADSLSSAEVHGVVGSQLPMHVRETLTNLPTPVGLLAIAPVSYLITILQREQVAQIRGCPIYVITDVALIPLSSRSEAQHAINEAKESLRKSGQQGVPCVPSQDSDTSDDDENHDEASQLVRDGSMPLGGSGFSTKGDLSATRPSSLARSTSSVAEDVIEKKGQYGRFAERWFSKKGWTAERRRAQGMSVDSVEKLGSLDGQVTALANPQSKSPLTATPGGAERSDQTADLEILNQAFESGVSGSPSVTVTNTLLPKLLRTTRMLLGSRSFFFSYELDITRRLGTASEKGSVIPLHKSADPLVSH